MKKVKNAIKRFFGFFNPYRYLSANNYQQPLPFIKPKSDNIINIRH